ncbi:MAG: polysaccharide deacetylase family protein [Rhodospirillales bacterium]|nr:polysaccharide deacetylase family protein [Rhodospirillales bacterium]MDP6883087.1 polysaccharide deacetylase family protein [Rhodospirillales bacterium]
MRHAPASCPRRRRTTIVTLRIAAVVFTVLAAGGWTAGGAAAAESAVVFMYHRFAEPAYPATNISVAQFEAHLDELGSGGYTVLAVPDILDSLGRGAELPDRTVGLTVDDAFLSVYTEAWPRLRKAGYPFTVFVATNAVDAGYAGQMTWDQIREMAAAGVTIGAHTASHLHMPLNDRTRNAETLKVSNARFAAELGRQPTIFAYPYGEASLEIQGLVRDAGYVAAFGQHSGVLNRWDDFYYLPRFSLSEKYGDLDRFRRVANALPLPVSDITPADPLVTDDNPPAIGFSVMAGVTGLGRLACYASHEGKARMERLGDSRVEIRLRTPLPVGRSRLNCTLPTSGGRWRWFGRQFYVAP